MEMPANPQDVTEYLVRLCVQVHSPNAFQSLFILNLLHHGNSLSLILHPSTFISFIPLGSFSPPRQKKLVFE